MHKGHREYLEALIAAGEVVKVEREVDWNLEAGAITRRVCELRERSPLFLKIKDYPGCRLHGAPMASYRRVAVAMGLAPDTPIREMLEEYERRVQRPVKPMLVKGGPCKENIVTGKEINLLSFPAPIVHDGDGGRYLATWHVIVTKDREQTNWVNWGVYRCMVHNEKYMAVLILPTSDIGRMFAKYEAANEPMPIAIAIGADPCSTMAGTASPGPGVNEADIAGALAQEPIELVKCETVDLEVPADAEVIIEGHVLPGARVDEGPFGEFTGYRTSPRAARPVLKVSAISYRSNPVIPLTNPGLPVEEDDILFSVTWRGDLKAALAKLPVVGFHIPPEAKGLLAVVAVRKLYEGIAEHVANAIWGTKFAYMIPYIIVVDEDVDPHNWNEVLHAMFTKLHPVRGIHVRQNTPGHPLLPYLNSHERKWGIGANLLFDLTWPRDWDPYIDIPQKASFKDMYPVELQKKVLANWSSYGF
jgi:phenylphosphate carboxylase alpha subunit